MKENLRSFFIKLFAISVAVIIIINLVFNILLGERLEKIDKIISLGDSSTRNDVKLKIRSELNKGLDKENIVIYGLTNYRSKKVRLVFCGMTVR